MIYLREEEQHVLRAAAEKALGIVIDALGPEHRDKGIYLRSFHFPNPQEGYKGLVEQLACWVGGSANDDKFPKYHIVSMEKPIRLAANARTLGHFSSWESRIPDEQKYGGATMAMCTVADLSPEPTLMLTSASGLPEKGDEAFTILTPMFAGWKPRTVDIMNILLKSGNQLAIELFQQHAKLAS